MPPKKRRVKNPSAWKRKSKPRVVTDATKANLPLPKGHPQKRVRRKRPDPAKVQWEAAERAIPCGEDVNGRDILDAKQKDVKDADLWFATSAGRIFCGDLNCPICHPITVPAEYEREIARTAAKMPPDTSAYPWGLKFAWWLDGVPTRVRRRLAARLRALAGKVAP